MIERWHLPGPNTVRVYLLYGGIAAGNAALGWPEDGRITWRFWLTVFVAALTVWKSIGSAVKAKERDADATDKSLREES